MAFAAPERRRVPFIIAVPALAITAIMLVPVVYLVFRSIAAGTDIWVFLARPRIISITLRTLGLVIGVTFGACALGIPIAWILTRTDLPWRRGWTVLTAIPLVIPSFVYALVVTTALSPRGLVQQMLSTVIGVPELPSIFGFPAAFLTLTLLTYPFVLLPTRAALTNLDSSLEEVSRTLGRDAWRTFTSVTLRTLRPAIASGALLVALYTLSDFGAVSLLRYETFTAAIFVQYESAFDRSLASALSLMLAVIAIAIVTTEARTRGRARYHRLGPGASRTARIQPLGRWRWPVLAGLGTVILTTTIAPTGVLVFWIIRGVLRGESFGDLGAPLINSISVSALATAALVVISIPLGIFIVRYPGKLSGFVERTTYIGFALPALTVAISLVFFGIHVFRPIYQTLLMLIVAYAVLFLPSMLSTVRTGILQLNPRVEEAARTLGATPRQVFTRITIPLVRESVLAGSAVSFLLVMKELPATLILGPVDFRTLATTTWSATSESFFASAAASALLLILVASIPLTLLLNEWASKRATHSYF